MRRGVLIVALLLMATWWMLYNVWVLAYRLHHGYWPDKAGYLVLFCFMLAGLWAIWSLAG